MKRCKCGELVDDHVRFHFAKPHEENEGTEAAGHYVTDPIRDSTNGDRPGFSVDESWPKHMVRASVFFGHPPYKAPPPGPVPAKPWGLEAELRRGCVAFLQRVGFAVYDLEQGYRDDGSSRVGEGIGDVYFHGLGIRGWVECKRWDNKPSEAQRAFGLEELEAGGIYLLVYEVAQLVTWNQLRRRS